MSYFSACTWYYGAPLIFWKAILKLVWIISSSVPSICIYIAFRLVIERIVLLKSFLGTFPPLISSDALVTYPYGPSP